MATNSAELTAFLDAAVQLRGRVPTPEETARHFSNRLPAAPRANPERPRHGGRPRMRFAALRLGRPA
jgi:hypothetical protein